VGRLRLQIDPEGVSRVSSRKPAGSGQRTNVPICVSLPNGGEMNDGNESLLSENLGVLPRSPFT
jgi:hypothetical protein